MVKEKQSKYIGLPENPTVLTFLNQGPPKCQYFDANLFLQPNHLNGHSSLELLTFVQTYYILGLICLRNIFCEILDKI